MGKKQIPPRTSTDIEVADFMSEFARVLIEAGVNSIRFFEIVRQAYFTAASSNAKFRNSRTNQSAVAAMTGLTRVQVRAFARTGAPVRRPRPGRLENIVKGWNTDAAFTTSNLVPRRLRIGGKNSTFGQLVRKYGGDVPARSILREMTRTGLVTLKGEFVHLNQQVRQTRNEAKLQHLSMLFSQLIRQSGSASNQSYNLRSVIREVTYPSASSRGRAGLQRRATLGMEAFISELEAAGRAASIETPPRRSRAPLVTRSRVLMITEEIDNSGSN